MISRRDLLPIWWIARRELRDQFRDWRILFPLAVLTLIFPLLMNIVAGEAVDFVNRYGGNLVLDRLVPFSVLIIGFFPITVSLVVALEAFVGEKERGTIEPLLSTPLEDWQLYFGKLLVGALTPLAASMLAIAFYMVIVSRQDLTMPNAHLMAQLLALTVAHAVLMVSGAIAVSTQSTSVRAANLLASFIILPVAILIQGETVLVFWGNDRVLWLAVLAVSIMAALLVRVGLAHFRREYLLGRELDTLNFRWMGRTFWRAFKGEARSPIQWYRVELASTLRRLRLPLLLVVALALLGAVVGFFWTRTYLAQWLAQTPPEEVKDMVAQLQEAADVAMPDFALSFPWIFLHNVRAVLVMFLGGAISFSVLGMLFFLVNMGVVGAAMAAVDLVGLSPWRMFAAGLLPHGVFELPALFLAGASILYLGAVLVTPNEQRTMGTVFIEALADWAKVMVGLVIPLLAVAAVVEAYLTPLILLWTLR
ncbi:MAG: hypothetical protein D6770_11030 [Anaerolineae bacterium]|nr:MAG: hypothetical protein D6770_11030 [Anaerolineae bacterium]